MHRPDHFIQLAILVATDYVANVFGFPAKCLEAANNGYNQIIQAAMSLARNFLYIRAGFEGSIRTTTPQISVRYFHLPSKIEELFFR